MTPLLLLFLLLAVLGAVARWGADTRESGEWRWFDENATGARGNSGARPGE